ncbi:MAG: hypothetical protein U0T73_03540 [Chitinophagales bacterium]
MKKTGFILVLLFVRVAVMAQCAMCSAVADEAAKNGSSAGDGINKGVLYMFVTPYLIVATIGFLWWRARKKAKLEMEEAKLSATSSLQ